MRKAKLAMMGVCIMGFSLLTGCASIVDGTHQSISVETVPISGASCSLKNDKGKWFVRNTPGSVTVHKSYHNLQVICHKLGYNSAQLSVKSHTKAMAFGNILLGGGIGAGVDASDGAAYNYPALIKVPLTAK